MALARDPVDGALTFLGGLPIGSLQPFLALDPEGDFLFALDPSLFELSVLAIDPQDGTLSSNQTVGLVNVPTWVAVDATGARVYVGGQVPGAASGQGVIEFFDLDRTLGEVSPAGRTRTYAWSDELALVTGSAPVSRRAFGLLSANAVGDSVSSFRIGADGRLTEVSGSPLTTGNAATSIGVDPLGRYAFVANTADADLSILRIDPITAELTEVADSPVNTGPAPLSVRVDRSGTLVFVGAADGVRVFQFDRDSETLTESAVQVPLPAPEAERLAVDPTGRWSVAAANANETPLMVVGRIDYEFGQLIASSQSAALSFPRQIHDLEFDGTGQFLMVTANDADVLESFQVSTTSGLPFDNAPASSTPAPPRAAWRSTPPVGSSTRAGSAARS